MDVLPLDVGDPRFPVKGFGGTGRVHNRAPSRGAQDEARATGVAVFRAAGLGAANVGDAIAWVRAFGVDVCSGMPTKGRLDPAKLATLASALAEADRVGVAR